MSCLTECTEDLVAMVDVGCDPVFRTGGAYRLAFKKCTASFSDVSGGSITNLASWTALLDDDSIVKTNDIVVTKDAGSPTTIRTGSCSPERVISRTTTYNVVDYSHDAEGLTEFPFYIDKNKNFSQMDLLVVTCDDLVYLYPAGTWNISSGEVREGTKEEPAHIDSTITIIESNMTAPVKVVGISGIL